MLHTQNGIADDVAPSRTIAAIQRLQFLGIDEIPAPHALDTRELEDIGDLAVRALMEATS